MVLTRGAGLAPYLDTHEPLKSFREAVGGGREGLTKDASHLAADRAIWR